MNETLALQLLVEAAAQAPSGDGLQPWRFVIDTIARTISFFLDKNQSDSAMNPGERISFIAVGTALENLFQFAQGQGWIVECENAKHPALATVRLVSFHAGGPEIDPVILARTTNRQPYDGRRLPAELVQKLRLATESSEGVQSFWITERDRLAALAIVIGRADALILESASLREAFLDNIRIDAAEDGDASLKFSPWIPAWVFSRMGGARLFEVRAKSLVSSASGLFVVFEDSPRAQSDLFAGRLVERAWLELTREKLTAQPMMSLAILDAILLQERQAVLDSSATRKATELRAQFHNLIPEAKASSIAFLLRFGHVPLSRVPATRHRPIEKPIGITV